MGGGLIRSLGGWAEVKGERKKVRDRIKGDDRILGGSEFVRQMLAEAHEEFEQRNLLKRMGYDLISELKKRGHTAHFFSGFPGQFVSLF